MDCDFIKNLSAEQRNQLRKLLDKTPLPQYRVEVEFWDQEKTKIAYLREYMGDRQHGVWKSWYENGQPGYEYHYQNGQSHGLFMTWNACGMLCSKKHYRYGKFHGNVQEWDQEGNLVRDEKYDKGVLVS